MAQGALDPFALTDRMTLIGSCGRRSFSIPGDHRFYRILFCDLNAGRRSAGGVAETLRRPSATETLARRRIVAGVGPLFLTPPSLVLIIHMAVPAYARRWRRGPAPLRPGHQVPQWEFGCCHRGICTLLCRHRRGHRPSPIYALAGRRRAASLRGRLADDLPLEFVLLPFLASSRMGVRAEMRSDPCPTIFHDERAISDHQLVLGPRAGHLLRPPSARKAPTVQPRLHARGRALPWVRRCRGAPTTRASASARRTLPWG